MSKDNLLMIVRNGKHLLCRPNGSVIPGQLSSMVYQDVELCKLGLANVRITMYCKVKDWLSFSGCLAFVEKTSKYLVADDGFELHPTTFSGFIGPILTPGEPPKCIIEIDRVKLIDSE